MIKGLAITPPVIGRISIGKIVEKNGKRLPEKDDSFTLTTQVQNKDGWMLHPLHQKLLEGTANAKIRAIPVRLLFNSSDLNLRAEYSLFDRTTGRPMCVGNGETAKGVTVDGIKEFACPSPDGCEPGRKGGCKPFGRLNVQVDGQNDDLGSFIFRTTGFNSIRTLAARLTYFEAISGGYSRYLPLQLKLRAKSTTQSHRAPVYYVDLCLRDGVSLEEAVTQAKAEAEREAAAGVDIQALELAARLALSNGTFEESEEEAPALVEEFYPETEGTGATESQSEAAVNKPRLVPRVTKLTDRLGAKVGQGLGVAAVQESAPC
jgi:hypothetical protein